MLHLFGLILKFQEPGNSYQDFDLIVAENREEANRKAETLIQKRAPGRMSVKSIWQIDQVEGHQIVVR